MHSFFLQYVSDSFLFFVHVLPLLSLMPQSYRPHYMAGAAAMAGGYNLVG